MEREAKTQGANLLFPALATILNHVIKAVGKSIMVCLCYGVVLLCTYFAKSIPWQLCSGNLVMVKQGSGVYQELVPLNYTVEVWLA